MDDTDVDQKVAAVATAHVKRRRAMLKDLGIQNERDIQKLVHSGRNGLTHYLKNNWSVLATQTPLFPERSTLPTTTAATTSSGATASLTQTTQALASNPTDSTNIVEQLSTAITAFQAALSASTFAQKKPTLQ